MSKATALMLNDDAMPEVWAYFEGTPFSDNGGEPEGNAWLTTDYEQEEADAVVAAGLGKFVDVRELDIPSMAVRLNIRFLDLGEFDRDGGIVGFADAWRELDRAEHQQVVNDLIIPRMEDAFERWAYYSASESFIVIEHES